MSSILNVEAVLGDAAELGLQASEISDVLAIAYLAMSADGRLSPEEIDAFERAVAALLGSEGTLHRAGSLMDRFGEEAKSKGLSAMLAETAGRLKGLEARHVAYKLAYVMSLSDLDTNDDEFLFEEDLRQALGLPEETAEELIDEVIEAIEAEGDDDEDEDS